MPSRRPPLRRAATQHSSQVSRHPGSSLGSPPPNPPPTPGPHQRQEASGAEAPSIPAPAARRAGPRSSEAHCAAAWPPGRGQGAPQSRAAAPPGRAAAARDACVFGIISNILNLIYSEPSWAGRRRSRRLRAGARSCWTARCDIGRTGPGGAALSARDRTAPDRLHGPGRCHIDRTGRATSSRPTGTTPSR